MQAATNEALGAFRCPHCQQTTFLELPASAVGWFRRRGATPIAGCVPFEILERHGDEPLRPADVSRWCTELAGTDCPQTELLS